jgi:hypothetical protein
MFQSGVLLLYNSKFINVSPVHRKEERTTLHSHDERALMLFTKFAKQALEGTVECPHVTAEFAPGTAA